jgi:hypothetical protein
MPQPTPGDAHVNVPLTNISVAFLQSAQGFVADDVFPVVPVEQQSNLYYQFTKEDFFRDEAKLRAPATESAGGGFTLSTASYSANVEAFHSDIDDQLRANADSILSLDRAATELVTHKLMIRRERRWMSSFFTTGVWGTDITPGTLWSVSATADPRKDVETGKMAIQAATGFKPNTLVLGTRVLSALRYCQQIIDQFKYTSADSINTDMLAGFFDIDRIIVTGAVWTNAVEGNATQTTDFIGGKHALLCYSAPAPSLMAPSAGYTFAWRGYTGAINGLRIKKLRADLAAADRIEGEMAYDMKKVAASLGYFFNGAVA